MIRTLVLIAVQFAILSVVGWAAIALLPRRQRELLLPGVPLFGAAFVAVVMTTTSHFASARLGVGAVLVIVVALLALAVWRAPDGLRLGRRAVAAAALVTVVSGVGAGVALVPTHWAGDNRATPAGGSLDLFYYAAEADWITHHSVEEGPDIGPRPGTGNATPAYRPMEVANIAPLRAGQAMVVAALDTAMGRESVDTITPAVVLWVLLAGIGAAVSALILGLGLRVALVAALVGNGSAMLLTQFNNGNADSLLGTGLALATITSVLAAVDRRLGIWLPALTAAGLVAVYTEFALYVAPAVAGGVLIGARRDIGPKIVRVLQLSLLSVVIAPFGWTRGIATLLMDRSTAGMGLPSPFYTDGAFAAVARFLGVSTLAEVPDHRWPGLLAAALVAGGLVCAVLLRPERGAWIALLAVGAAYIARLTAQDGGYVQLRAVELIGPLVFFIALVGYAAGLVWLVPRLAARRTVLVGGVAVVAAFTLVGTNLHTAYATYDRNLIVGRHVDGTYAQAADWVERLGGPEGRDVTVLNPDISSQIWLAYALREERLVAYPALHMSYLWPTEYWGGEVDPYVLLGPGTFSDGARGAVVRRNHRYRLIRLEGTGAVVAAPIELLKWVAFVGADGAMAGPDLGKILVETGTEASGPLTLHVRIPGIQGHELAASVDGVRTTVVKIRRNTTDITIDLGDRHTAVIELDIDADGVSEGTVAERAFYLDGVSVGAAGHDEAPLGGARQTEVHRR